MQRQKKITNLLQIERQWNMSDEFWNSVNSFFKRQFSPPSLSSLLKLPKDTTYQFTLSLQTTFAVNLLLNKEGK